MNPSDIERLRPFLRDGMTAASLATSIYGDDEPYRAYYNRQHCYRYLLALERAGIVAKMDGGKIDRNGRPRVRRWKVIG